MKNIVVALLILLITLSILGTISPQVSGQSAFLTEFTQLTTNPMRDRQPIWSPDGLEITYFAFDDGGWYRHLWSMNPDGGDKIQLTFGNVVDESCDYSPDGTKIIFMRHRGGTTFDLMVFHKNTSTIETFLARGESLHDARWSNDGTRILFMVAKHSPEIYEIHMIDADGSNEVTLVSESYKPITAYWSPDDSKIVYTLSDGIWSVNTLPPYEKTRIYESGLEPVHCAYSPDGNYILYSTRYVVEGYQDLFIVDKDGNTNTQLTFDISIEYPFEWSPDGQHIVFGSKRSGNTDIWRARINIISPANVEINPNALNLRSGGKWITAYIELPEGYDVNDIDISTIMLNNTVSVDLDAPSAIGDYDNDSTPDLMVKFSRSEITDFIISVLGTPGKFTSVILTVSGELNSGTSFEGNDTIKAIYARSRGGGRGNFIR